MDMIVQCPHCQSEDVTNLSFDSNDFICNDCGETFEADNGIDMERDDDNENDAASDPSEDSKGDPPIFIDLDPKLALQIAKGLKTDPSEKD